jgi:hemerythrin superfamily protein
MRGSDRRHHGKGMHMTVKENGSVDIIDALTRDHREAEQLLGRYEAVDGHRDEWFANVRESLVRHEVAEELAVYPAVRKAADGSEDMVDSRLDEQAKAEEELSKLESMDIESAEFNHAFTTLRATVLEHAQNEERTVFPVIEASTSADDRQMMGRRYERAKAAAPTHPHPHLPDTGPANAVLGPVAALADRIRDAARNDDDQSHMATGI